MKSVSYKLNKVHSTPDGLTHCWRIAFNNDEFKDFRVQTDNTALSKLLAKEGLEWVARGFNYFMRQYAVPVGIIDHILKLSELPARSIN